MTMSKTYWDHGTSQTVTRDGEISMVVQGHGYRREGKPSAILQNTGNGYIARFPANSSTTQDYYVCLDYSQAYDLILAMSAFKKELGFV